MVNSYIKKQWLISLITFHSVCYFGSIIIGLIEAYFKGGLIWQVFDASYFKSVLLTQPLSEGFLGCTAYYYVYKLERKYPLKIVTYLAFLLTCFMAFKLNSSANYNWGGNYYIKIMITESLWFYAALFYFITSYRWYSRVHEYKNIILDIASCFLGLVLIYYSNNWIGILVGWGIIGWALSSDRVKNLLTSRLKPLMSRWRFYINK